MLAARTAASYLRFAPLEYRRYDDSLVAYDSWLDEPQWAAPLEEFRDVSVLTDRIADRLTGARTFRFTVGWGDETDRQVGPVADPAGAIDAFELPVSDTDAEPLDRRYVLAGSVGVLAYVAVVATSPLWADSALIFFGAFGFPFVTLFATSLWRRSYPDRVDRGPEPSWRE